MTYNKKIYQDGWGKLYRILLNISGISILVCSFFLNVFLYAIMIGNIQVSAYATKLMVILIILEVILFVVNYYALCKKKGRAKRLKIFTVDNKLYVSDTIKHGISFDTYNPFQTISYDYLISNIDSWKKDNRYYYLTGVFEPVETIDGISYESNKVLTRLRIPIVFDEQDKFEIILNVLRPGFIQTNELE